MSSLSNTPMVRMICGECGSSDVAIEASAVWDIASQKWVLAAVIEDALGVCYTCENDTVHVEKTES